MRILLVHNYYRWPGGEDQVFAAETELLESNGHTVLHYTIHNEQIVKLGKLALGGKTLWNLAVYEELRSLCRQERPQIVHFHNTFPLASPAAYYAAKREGATVIQTLHNYRLLCPGTTFFRDGRVCEDCLGRAIPWPSVLHGCYRGSRSASTGVALMIATHRAAGTWTKAVDLYIAPTDFLRRKFLEGGLTEAKIVCKPHFLAVDPGAGEHKGGYALFVGRLAEEKGIRQLRDAWLALGQRVPLKIVGDGPLSPLLQGLPAHVEWLGHRPREEAIKLMQDASFLVFPSEWYEAFGLTIMEAFATGLPVIAGKLGAPADLVEHGRTGLHFVPGSAAALAAAVDWAIQHPAEMTAMGETARKQYLEKYTSTPNYLALMEIYHHAMSVNPRNASGMYRGLAAQRFDS